MGAVARQTAWMVRHPRVEVTRLAAVLAIGTVLSACGGSAGSSLAVPLATPTIAASKSGAAVGTASLKITIPSAAGGTTAGHRRANYVSSATAAVVVTTLSATADVPLPAPQSFTVAPGVGTCGAVSSGVYSCTLALTLPPGSDSVLIQAQSGETTISQQQTTLHIVQGGANAAIAVTLDALPGTPTVTITPSTQTDANTFYIDACGDQTMTVQEHDVLGTSITSAAGDPLVTLQIANPNAPFGTFVATPQSVNAGSETYAITAQNTIATLTITETAANDSDGITSAQNASRVITVQASEFCSSNG